jgi:flagellar biogenesis protein FliO
MEYVRQMAAVGAVFMLLGGLLWWMRGRGLAMPGRARARRRLEVIERLALAPQQSLHLVRLDGNTFLVACSPSGCTLLQAIEAER